MPGLRKTFFTRGRARGALWTLAILLIVFAGATYLTGTVTGGVTIVILIVAAGIAGTLVTWD